MFRTRLDGSEVLEFNEKYLKILGYTIDEVKGIQSKNIWVNKHEREKMVEQIKVEGQVVDLECELLTREGKVINCITSLKLYCDTGILEGSILDITDRLLAEKTVRENEERMRDIIFSIGDWVWEVDENGIYTYSSQKGYDLFDSSHENILGKTPFDFMPADEAKRVRIIFSELASKKAPIKDLENWNIGENDEKICLLTNGVPILDKDGNLKGYRGVDKDITDFKKNEAALKKMNEVMTSLHQRLENIREEEQAQISRNIHDHLGQSLTSLKFDLGTLIDKTERGSMENLKLEGMIEMVTQIIRNVQRISSELRPPALDELGLSAAMEWYCEEIMERTGLQLHLELDNVQTENMNKNLALYKVLKESLTNIIRHAGAKNVLVKLCVSEKAILLTIKDDGIGITPDKINSVKSLGILGMFERIRQFGGDIEIGNPDKKGTEVKVRLSVK
jgi:PAS domain S-box-containing protein